MNSQPIVMCFTSFYMEINFFLPNISLILTGKTDLTDQGIHQHRKKPKCSVSNVNCLYIQDFKKVEVLIQHNIYVQFFYDAKGDINIISQKNMQATWRRMYCRLLLVVQYLVSRG